MSARLGPGLRAVALAAALLATAALAVPAALGAAGTPPGGAPGGALGAAGTPPGGAPGSSERPAGAAAAGRRAGGGRSTVAVTLTPKGAAGPGATAPGSAGAPGAEAEPAEDAGPAATIAFWVIAGFTLLFALGVIALRSPLAGAVSLIFAFLGVAGLYVLLEAHLLAAIQVIVYAGAVMALFVFVIMLLNLSERELGSAKAVVVKILALALIGAAATFVWRAFDGADSALPSPPAAVPEGFGTVKAVGRSLYGEWLLAFELVGLLILVAVVGAVVIGRRRAAAAASAPRAKIPMA